VTLEVIETGYRIEVTGEGAESLPRDESHLILRSALVGLADLGLAVPGLALSCHNTIPHGRGLGSSSAAIVAGLCAAQGLAGRPIDRPWTVGHADAIEGHPDNVAAAVYGGFVLAYEAAGRATVVRTTVADGLGAVLFVPTTPLGTQVARGLLPANVPHADAAANSAHAALFVHAVSSDLTLLADATRDWLHQDYRQRAMPQSYELMQQLRGRGYAAVISGAGPTVLVLGRTADLMEIEQENKPGFRTLRASVGTGARVTSGDAP
jgi:homoserine kinase